MTIHDLAFTHADLDAADAGLVDALFGDEIADAEAVARLREPLAARAQAAGLLDVAYRVHDTPIGVLLLAATDAGLVRVAFDVEGFDAVLQGLADRISPRILAARGRLDSVARQVDDYFASRRRTFDIAIDWQLSRGFRAEVLHRLREIDFGHTASYAELAAASGRPTAVRAVGSACATNPIPIVVPCHRVVRSDGSLGGYRGGLDAKRVLLDLERRSA